jgi:hypothetical protein
MLPVWWSQAHDGMEESSMPQQMLACPNCHRIDQVQRVSALVKAETASIRGRGHTAGRFGGASWYGRFGAVGGSFSATTEISGQQATALGEALAPPNEPIYVHRWGVLSILLLILGLMAGWLAATTVPGLYCAYDPPGVSGRTACWNGQGSLFLQTKVGQTPSPAVLKTAADVVLIALPLGLLGGVVALRVLTGKRRRRRYHQAYQAWEQEYARWQQRHYCHRCDVVFEPGTAYSDLPLAPRPESLSYANA